MFKFKKPQKEDIENDKLLPKADEKPKEIENIKESDNMMPKIPGYEDIKEEAAGMRQKFEALVEESQWKP